MSRRPPKRPATKRARDPNSPSSVSNAASSADPGETRGPASGPAAGAPPLADAAAREAIRTRLDLNLVAEAAAGTGKTTELVHRMVAVIASGRATVDRMVAVTFTEKAAGEIKLRVREGLENERRRVTSGSAERRHLDHALARLEEAWVGTIHGFCAEILRERAVEAGVDPEFETLTEPEAHRAFQSCFRLWLEEALHDPPEGVRRSLRRPSRGDEEDADPVGRLASAGWALAQWRDFSAPWRRDPFDRRGEIEVLIEAVRAFAGMTEQRAKPTDKLYVDTEPARTLVRDLDAAESAREPDWDGLEAALIGLPDRKAPGSGRRFSEPRDGYGTLYGTTLPRAEVQDAHARLLRSLAAFRGRADADLAALLQGELAEVIDRYQQAKRRRGCVDFEDLLILARDLVRARHDVRAAFQRRFTHFFVDEFQDTDPVQAEILLLLASRDPAESDWERSVPEPGKLFVVGDPKQSIYRFRRADVGVYQKVKELLVRNGAACVHLTTSFRAVPAIQRLVNTAFSWVMRDDPASQQSAYVPLTPHRRANRSAKGTAPAGRGPRVEQPAIVALPVPEPFGGYGGITKTAVRESLPGAVGAFVEWLVQSSGWTVTERDDPDRPVPVAARHVCLLFRQLWSGWDGDLTRPYVEQLEARGIRHLLVGGRSYHAREEVEAMRTALTAVEWPDDELAVFATLRGPLFAVGDEELLEFRHLFRRVHPFRVPADLPQRLQPIASALDFLADLHRERNRRPVADTVHALLEETRSHAGFVFHPSGEQVLANVLHLSDQGRAYEKAGGLSFRGFVDRLAADAEELNAAEAPVLEEGADGVRMMTVHKAKGLEFPVVILADIGTPIARGQAGRHTDPARRLCALRIGGWSPVELLEAQPLELERDRAEGVRLAYVAATRARDLLVVPAVGTQAWDGASGRGAQNWIAPLTRALYPEPRAWGEAGEALGCPAFGDHSVVAGPGEDLASVRPGLHALPGDFDVVWWDPNVLRLSVPRALGIRKQELIAKEGSAEQVDRDRERYQEWKTRRESRIAAGSRPSLAVATATQRAVSLAAAGTALAEPVDLVDLGRDPERPAGARFGALVHAVLAATPLGGGEREIALCVALEGRVLGAPPAEVEAAARATRRVLAHPLLARARLALERGECRRETPLTLVEEGVVIDGQVDLAFLEDGTWTVVDFKTDRELDRALDVHRRQVALYARAIARATGAKAKAVLMRV